MIDKAVKVGLVAWVLVGSCLSIYVYGWMSSMAVFGVFGFSTAAILLTYLLHSHDHGEPRV